MNWPDVVVIYILLFALTTYVTYKKAGVWAKNKGEDIPGILLKSFVLWIYLAGFTGIVIGCMAVTENLNFYIALGEKLKALTASLISNLLPF